MLILSTKKKILLKDSFNLTYHTYIRPYITHPPVHPSFPTLHIKPQDQGIPKNKRRSPIAPPPPPPPTLTFSLNERLAKTLKITRGRILTYSLVGEYSFGESKEEDFLSTHARVRRNFLSKHSKRSFNVQLACCIKPPTSAVELIGPFFLRITIILERLGESYESTIRLTCVYLFILFIFTFFCILRYFIYLR